VSVSILFEGITTVSLLTINEVLSLRFHTRRAQFFCSQNNGLPRGPRTRNTMTTEVQPLVGLSRHRCGPRPAAAKSNSCSRKCHLHARTGQFSASESAQRDWPLRVGYGNSITLDNRARANLYAVEFGRSDIERRRLMTLIC
jgi:hypothetical protein